MLNIAARLGRTLETVVPAAAFDGVSIGSIDDRGTWAVQWTAEATDTDREMAQSVLAAFDPERPVTGEIIAEATRRIRARIPLETQVDMLARAVELLETPQADWTAADVQDAARIRAGREWARAIRARAAVLEQSRPHDFESDLHWVVGT